MADEPQAKPPLAARIEQNFDASATDSPSQPCPSPMAVGDPGLWGLVPVIGSGWAAINDFQNGRWGPGLIQLVWMATDFAPVKALAVAGGKLVFKLAAKVVVKEAVETVEKQVVKEVVKDVEKQVVKEEVEQVEKQAVKSRQRSGKRREYMGQNPSKESTTYRDVVERMRQEGKIQLKDGVELVQASDGTWNRLDEVELAHVKDAVKWWNETGKYWGPKHEKVREFMTNAENFVLDKPSLNRSAGAKIRTRYDLPDPRPGGPPALGPGTD